MKVQSEVKDLCLPRMLQVQTDGVGFSLEPWKPVIESRLGQQLAATLRRVGVSWEIGRWCGHVM